ncbi:hypothetical protein CsatB_014201 [Cannabis sativa]
MELQRSVMMRLFLGFLLLSFAPISIHGRFVVEKNSLRVTSSDRISRTNDSAIGNFGIPQYSGSMAGNVLYPKDNQKGCKEFSDFGISFQSKPGALPTFILLDRGGSVVPMLEAVMAVVPVEKLAVHFHDIYGQSLPNILLSLQDLDYFIGGPSFRAWCCTGNFHGEVVYPKKIMEKLSVKTWKIQLYVDPKRTMSPKYYQFTIQAAEPIKD